MNRCSKIALSFVLALVAGCGRPNGPLTLAEVGNGGHGVVSQGAVYLVDLVEAGIEKTPPPSELEQQKRNNFEGLLRDGVRSNLEEKSSPFPYKVTGQKLLQLYRGNPVLAMSILETIRMYQWNFVERDLKDIPVEGTVLSFGEGSVVLVANRRGRSIYVNLAAFKRMNAVNQTALVFHEALYALIKPTKVDGRTTQSAARVRELVGYLFGESEYRNSLARMEELLGDEFPPRLELMGHMVTFASHFQPTKDRVMIIDPKLTLEAPKGVRLEGLQFAFGPYSEPETCREKMDDYLQAATLEMKKAIRFRLVPGDEQKKGFLFQFADYEEKGEIKTYVKLVPLESKFENYALSMYTLWPLFERGVPCTTDDVLLHAYLVIMRTFPEFQADVRRTDVPEQLRRRADEIAKTTDVLLPHRSLPGIQFDEKK